MIVTHFIVSDDVERSRRFYTEVLGGTVVFGPEPTNIRLANTFIIINVGGGPTDDKPTVTLETPKDPDRVSSFLNIRVEDIHAVYAEWSARGRSSSRRRSSTRMRSAATSGIPIGRCQPRVEKTNPSSISHLDSYRIELIEHASGG